MPLDRCRHRCDGWRRRHGRTCPAGPTADASAAYHRPADGVTRLGPGAPPTPSCGAVVYVLARPGDGAGDAVELDALTAAGRRPADRWRRTLGTAGAVFELPAAVGGPWPAVCGNEHYPDPPPLAVALVEGPADALALARLRLPGVLVRAAGGTSGMTPAAVADLPPDVPAVPVSDGDKPGRAAVAKLAAELAAVGRPVYAAVLLAGDLDEALRGADDAALTDRHAERAAVFEYEAGAARPDATARALSRLLESLGDTHA